MTDEEIMIAARDALDDMIPVAMAAINMFTVGPSEFSDEYAKKIHAAVIAAGQLHLRTGNKDGILREDGDKAAEETDGPDHLRTRPN